MGSFDAIQPVWRVTSFVFKSAMGEKFQKPNPLYESRLTQELIYRTDVGLSIRRDRCCRRRSIVLLVTNSYPMIVKQDARVNLDCRHVASNAVLCRRNGTISSLPVLIN